MTRAKSKEKVVLGEDLDAEIAAEADGSENLHEAEPELEVNELEEEDPIVLLEQERDDVKDQLLRARAEFDNYRKRTAREAERTRKTAAANLVRDLLPVVDNLVLAFEHAEDKDSGLAQGIEMVLKQFGEVLSRNGVEPIETVGMAFDPHFHEALATFPSDEIEADKVSQEFQRGYTMGDVVLRHAKVAVSSGPAEESENAINE